MFKIGLRFFKGLIFFILCLQLAIGFGLAQDIAQKLEPSKAAKKDSSSYPSKVRLGAYGSTEDRGIFYIDYLFPLFYSQDQNTLFFLNPKQSWFTPHSSDEINIGAGIRHIFNDKFILGMHSFYDKKDSINHKLYSQVGYGFEFLSQPFDFRFNYYDPRTNAKVVDDGYELGSIYLVHWNGYEEPLEGYDFEFGFPIIPEKLKTRLYFGGFFFNSKLAKDVNGYRIRTESDINKWLAIDMSFNSRNAGETEFIGGLRFTIPLESGRLIDKKNPFKVTPRDSYIKERLFERVVRDIDVQTQSKGTTQKEDQQDVEIIYVDNSNTTGIEDGTLAHPYTTIASAIGDSRYIGAVPPGTAKYIYVAKGTDNYTENVSLSDEAVLWGSATDGGFNGLTITDYPVLSAGGDVVTMVNNNTVQGLKIQDGTNGIYASNSTGGTIRNNYITANACGIYIYTDSGETSNFTISGNTIDSNTGGGPYSGIDVRVYNGATISNLTISNNAISNNSGDGIYFYNYQSNMSDITLSDNTVETNSGDGIYIYNYEGTNSGFSISGNTIQDNTGGDGIHIYTAASYYATASTSDFTISGNTITGNANNGININNSIYGYWWAYPTTSNFSVSGNTIKDNTGYGVYLHNYYGTMSGIDFGGGAMSSEGRNSIYNNNSGTDVSNYSGEQLKAQNNYWGGTPAESQFSGDVDYSSYLTTDPNQ